MVDTVVMHVKLWLIKYLVITREVQTKQDDGRTLRCKATTFVRKQQQYCYDVDNEKQEV